MSDHERMMQMINGYWVSQIVSAAAAYSLADLFADGPATAEEIAQKARTSPTATFRLLRACAALGLVNHAEDGRFEATTLLNTMRSDDPHSLKDQAMLMASPVHWLPWGRFTDSVRTGEPQAVAALGKVPFEYLAERREDRELFARAIARVTSTVTDEVARLVDTRLTTIVADIGGASGALLHPMLKANSALKGVVLDLPNIVESAKPSAMEAGLQDRIAIVGGDFLKAVPPADLYLLRYILHDWNDDDAVRILANCRRAMLAGARIVIIERVIGENDEQGKGALMDLNMMVMLGGRERSLAEFGDLCSAAGLRIAAANQTSTAMATIIEAIAL